MFFVKLFKCHSKSWTLKGFCLSFCFPLFNARARHYEGNNRPANVYLMLKRPFWLSSIYLVHGFYQLVGQYTRAMCLLVNACNNSFSFRKNVGMCTRRCVNEWMIQSKPYLFLLISVKGRYHGAMRLKW